MIGNEPATAGHEKVPASPLTGLADNHAVYGGLHAFDGLLILAIPAYLYVRSPHRGS